MVVLDGKTLANKIKSQVKDEIYQLKSKGIIPGLAVILVGNNPASQVYVNMKTKACEEVGIYSINHRMPEEVNEKDLLYVIDMLNKNPLVNAILVQLPLPSKINEERVIEAIDPKKDVDGFHPYNMGRLLRGKPFIYPCTPYGVMKLFEEYNIELKGKDVCVIGTGNITGKPMSYMLLNEYASVQICHIYTKNLKDKTKNADIIISATGKAHLITQDMVKEGAVVVDVGITKINDKIVGDVDFENVSKIASYITPVPGGVGPMTIAVLIENTVFLAKQQNNIV
ncbi:MULTISPECIES: bifunctional methylenetetrahydrofolate dehydrogenase/methenyltetrahydrofolate cyclohydrolase FolD [Desulfurella]|jgi:methylenetetrahydrofolate dehydrogenase (NADP+)/methenyltetrahydrofolate cyclohydrolase|uniref:Bifunctional protein FolD n=1 Tax=Desulfurella multipotens TaxID=79269 RepID=A0A1G6NT14_9BACT|nr:MULTISPECIES: bifunctional methylenetetrahydrofolate dehydrogenase/methenyltetrahydrofolate cyclohydrolase FolD [Desulfurella]PMP63569.1 MAG: bifunctional methylenetetrahydrofolate dehydrogenase/methenyltetrahydrofolate cyclohydrolase FolD [Desulfurella multipotens]PMP88298.1 MAG: bifunctional methylenetetrahydrofolate dehydrogenase/methenyltetrahydrofolate cyclohydrolase FolD [Desulfurella sp.]SDC70396.1 methylenetetrahydrofolate dehydrogenase (NADP+) / methenyltetrahydrofolate cyclohydrolas